jgi:ubiquinol-cytochrome c reductase iron-sulfur subunit
LDTSEFRYGYNSVDNMLEEYREETSQGGDETNRTLHYLTIGSAAFLYASFGRSTVVKFVSYLSASADVMAQASVEVDVSGIAEGNSLTIKWRGKPVFIRHRSEKEIAAAKADDGVELRDPQKDADRLRGPEKYLVLLGVCTHLGCVPASGAGDYGGWFCPCHGSHYDLSGRIRKGPAPLNLEVPPYKFLSDSKVLLG